MKYIAVIAAACATITASEARAERTVITCEGPASKVGQSDKTAEELKISLGMTTDPKTPDSVLMRFETPQGKQIWSWSDEPVSSLEGHCRMQYYKKEKPLDGTWLLTQENVSLEGCPEGVAVPSGFTGTRELAWEHVFSPRQFFKDSQIKFDMSRVDLNQNHWIASAEPIPELPGTLDITYDFKVVNPKRIDITGAVTIKIDGGAMKADCTGTVDLVARHQG